MEDGPRRAAVIGHPDLDALLTALLEAGRTAVERDRLVFSIRMIMKVSGEIAFAGMSLMRSQAWFEKRTPPTEPSRRC